MSWRCSGGGGDDGVSSGTTEATAELCPDVDEERAMIMRSYRRLWEWGFNHITLLRLKVKHGILEEENPRVEHN